MCVPWFTIPMANQIYIAVYNLWYMDGVCIFIPYFIVNCLLQAIWIYDSDSDMMCPLRHTKKNVVLPSATDPKMGGKVGGDFIFKNKNKNK